MKHIVGVSGGLSSALAWRRVLDRYGKADVEGVFENTSFEDEDNYCFLGTLERIWGVSLTMLVEGRTPYEVFEQEHIIPNSRIAPCTRRLKVEPFVAYLQEHYAGQAVTIHIGYDFSEAHRCNATQLNYEAHGWSVDFPLLWKPYEFRRYEDVCRQDWGIEPPRMYALGYSHANCGGRCVKQGHGDWLRTLIHFPERYARVEAWEQRMRENPTNADYAILKDRRGGAFRGLTLRELRERYEQARPGQAGLMLLDEETGGCLYCGVGDLLSGGALGGQGRHAAVGARRGRKAAQ